MRTVADVTSCDECSGTGKWQFGATDQARYLASQLPCPKCHGETTPAPSCPHDPPCPLADTARGVAVRECRT